MTKKWVVNASPLIILAKISHLHLLEQLSRELVIPGAVSREIRLGPQDNPARIWLKGRGAPHIKEAQVDEGVAAWDLGQGESEVLSWARLNPGFEALVDDRAARKCAQTLNIPVRGTLGVILLAKREGILAEVAPVFARRTDAGLHIDRDLLYTARRPGSGDAPVLLTIEHVMPRSWIAHWPLDEPARAVGPDGETAEQRRNRLIDTFGNLTLVTQPLNSSVSNSAYRDKRPAITKQSALRLNAYFQEIDSWDEEAILTRGAALFEVASKVWAHPG